MEIKPLHKLCWKCGQITTIIETNIRFLKEKEFGEEIRKNYPFFYPDFSKESEEGYYMNHCEHCGEKQGDNYLFIERLLENNKKRLQFPNYPKFHKKVKIPKKAHQTTLDEYLL